MSISRLFFDTTPEEITFEIFQYLKGEKGSLSRSSDDKAILTTAQVCKRWQDDPVLQKERQEAVTRLRQRINLQKVHDQLIEHEYPPEMVQIFRNCNLPIARLPQINYCLQSGGLYYPFLERQEMTHAVMRFKHFEHVGIALRIHAKRIPRELRRGTESILGIFKSFDRWTHLWGDNERSIFGGLYPKNLKNRLLGLAKAPIIDDRKLVRIALIRTNLRSLRSLILGSFRSSRKTDFSCSLGIDHYDQIKALYNDRHKRIGHKGDIVTCSTICFDHNVSVLDPIQASALRNLLTGKDPDFTLVPPLPKTSQFRIFVIAAVAIAMLACFVRLTLIQKIH